MLFAFVNDCLFDDEMEAVEEGYSVGILMIIIHLIIVPVVVCKNFS